MLEELAGHFSRRFASKYEIVEPAHMELAEPSISSAYAACVKRGAERVRHMTFNDPNVRALLGVSSIMGITVCIK